MALDSVIVSDVMDDVITPTIENDEAELLIIASIQTLKRKNKRCGRDEVFELVKDSTDDDTVTKETFDKLLNQLINNNSVKLNTVGNRECLSLPTKSNKKNQQSHIEDPLSVENCFTNLKSVITDEFESLKKSFLQEVITFKNKLLQTSLAKTPDNHSERLIGHLESQILFLQRELNEKNQLVNSLLDQLSKCNDIIKINQESSSKNKVKPFESDSSTNQDKFTETNTTANKESNKSGKKNELNETPSEEKNDKSNSQQNTSIRGSNNNKSEKTRSHKLLASKTDNKKDHKQKTVIILGDSMIKHVNGWEISRKLQGNCKVYVKHFSGAKTKCMKDYIKPSQRENSDHYILHVGTNDLCLDRSPELIAKSIIDLALTLKNESHDVSVSNIIVRNDSDTLNKKGCEVNAVLMEMCREKNIYLIDNSKKVKPQHINKGKLHLNQKGSRLLSDMFLKEISRVFN